MANAALAINRPPPKMTMKRRSDFTRRRFPLLSVISIGKLFTHNDAHSIEVPWEKLLIYLKQNNISLIK